MNMSAEKKAVTKIKGVYNLYLVESNSDDEAIEKTAELLGLHNHKSAVIRAVKGEPLTKREHDVVTTAPFLFTEIYPSLQSNSTTPVKVKVELDKKVLNVMQAFTEFSAYFIGNPRVFKNYITQVLEYETLYDLYVLYENVTINTLTVEDMINTKVYKDCVKWINGLDEYDYEVIFKDLEISKNLINYLTEAELETFITSYDALNKMLSRHGHDGYVDFIASHMKKED